MKDPYRKAFVVAGEPIEIEKVTEQKFLAPGELGSEVTARVCYTYDKDVADHICMALNLLHNQKEETPPRTHKQVHKELHHSLDLLMADYAVNTGKLFEESSILDLLTWSFRQTYHPDGKYDPHWEQENPIDG